jgi:hypothetical protein|tara:strand:- start:26552 stop:27136 length:585 start_codon:yes stop_codon:yes gene_type:complete
MARIASGEVGVHHEGREYIFRPSFRRMDELEQDWGIRDQWDDLRSEIDDVRYGTAAIVLWAFFTGSDEDALNLTGYKRDIYHDGEFAGTVYVPGIMDQDEQVVIAMALLRNGLCGVSNFVDKKSDTDSFSSGKFNAYDFVFAIAQNLEISKTEAEDMTMAEYHQALKVMNPERFVDMTEENEKTDALLKAVGWE